MEDINRQIFEKKEKEFRIRETLIRCKLFSERKGLKIEPIFPQIDEGMKWNKYQNMDMIELTKEIEIMLIEFENLDKKEIDEQIE